MGMLSAVLEQYLLHKRQGVARTLVGQELYMAKTCELRGPNDQDALPLTPAMSV